MQIWKFYFYKKYYCIRYNIRARSYIKVKRRYVDSYFFLISRLRKYCTIIFIRKTVWKVFMLIFNTFLPSSSYRCKAIIKGISNIIGIAYSIIITQGAYSWHNGSYCFKEIRNLILFHVFLILFPISVRLFTFLHKDRE